MGLFKRKEANKNKEEIPKLPELPKLPEIPEVEGIDKNKEEIPKLPELPQKPTRPEIDNEEENERVSGLSSNFSKGDKLNKFLETDLKNVISGGEEGENETYSEKIGEDQEIPSPFEVPLESEKKRFVKEIPSKEIMKISSLQIEKEEKKEPLFIRIDKFEESAQHFENIKKQISDIEKMVSSLKEIKEDEGEELQNFEEGIKEIKERLELIDRNMFSGI